LSYYVIEDFSQAFSLRDQGIIANPYDYNARVIGEPVNSWSYLDGRDLFYLDNDSWGLNKFYFTSFPQRSGIVLKDLNTEKEYWFITDYLSEKSKENWERITCPDSEKGGGDPVLVFPLAPPGYIYPQFETDNDGDGYTENDGDCNDADNFVYPGAIEICGDDIDQDCNGFDLYCDGSSSVTLSWGKPDDNRVIGYNIYCGISGTDFKTTPVETINTADQTSCLILNLEAGFEYSFTATSLDADGNESDFSETICYIVQSQVDIDNDGDGWTVGEGDCNDDNPDIYPGAIEICGDGIDQDCNGEDSVLPSAQCVVITVVDNGYLISNLSSAFSISRDQGILINPERYSVRMIGEPVNSWSYSDGKDLLYLSEDSWVLNEDYLTVEPKKIGFILKDRETAQEYWFITAFLCEDSRGKFERITDPVCPYGGGDVSLIIPEAPQGYFPCN
ncbi:fibronectin type III domain-containing protein, partial [bacterium]|nr:fibronectin type III domain-containing protein [bacterium]